MTGGAISVAIVNYQGARYLERTLRAVAQCGAIIDEVLLVDNGSTDGSVALALQCLPGLRVVELVSNRGPGAAMNAALREARHDRVLLLDNDVRPQPGCVEALAGELDTHPCAVIAMPAVCYEQRPEVVQYVAAEAHFLGTSKPRCADTPLARLQAHSSVVGSAITACLLVDRARFGERPWFDEQFFIYSEDHELGLRISLLGFEALAVPGARCLHAEGTVGVSIRETGRYTPVRVRYTIRNRWMVLLKLYRWRTLLRFAPALGAFELIQLLGAVKKGWLSHWLWAVGSLARQLPELLRRRRAFQRTRRRDDLAVLVGGPFPYNPSLPGGGLERTVRRALDRLADLNWRLAGGRR